MLNVSLRLASLFSQLTREWDSGLEGTPSDTEAYIMAGCGFPAELCEALAMGHTTTLCEVEGGLHPRPLVLTVEQVECLADLFGLESELLACLLRPTSPEVLRQACEDMMGSLDIDDCEDCAQLCDRIEFLVSPTDAEEVEELACDLLAHVIDNGDDSEEGELRAEIGEMVAMLDLDALLRIKEVCLDEAALALGEAADNELAAEYMQLRELYMTEFPRRVCDALARVEGHTLTAEDLSLALGLTSPAALAQLPRLTGAAVESAVQHQLAVINPLLIVQTGSTRIYRLTGPAAALWPRLIAPGESQLNNQS